MTLEMKIRKILIDNLWPDNPPNYYEIKMQKAVEELIILYKGRLCLNIKP